MVQYICCARIYVVHASWEANWPLTVYATGKATFEIPLNIHLPIELLDDCPLKVTIKTHSFGCIPEEDNSAKLKKDRCTQVDSLKPNII